MIDPAHARARFAALRERDRTIASMQSKQRLRPAFTQLLDEEAREALTQGLRQQLVEVRREAAQLALDLGRRALVEVGVEDLGRLGSGLRKLEAHLAEAPAEALDTCFDLLTFLDERAELWGSESWTTPPIEP